MADDPADAVHGAASAIRAAVFDALVALPTLDPDVRPRARGWTRREILGHLVDSAVNNLQRIVRLANADGLRFPDYEQDEWVRIQAYAQREWRELIDEWRLLNRHLAHLVERLPPAAVSHRWLDHDVTLGWVAIDYVRHLRHHLAHIDARCVR